MGIDHRPLSVFDAAQHIIDTEEAKRRAVLRLARLSTGQLTVGEAMRDHCKTLDELEAEELLAVSTDRTREAAKNEARAKLAAARAQGVQDAINEQVSQPAPTNQPALTFEQARMLQRVAIEADEQFHRDRSAGAPHKPQEAYIDEAARRYLASQAQPAPATEPSATQPAPKKSPSNPLTPVIRAAVRESEGRKETAEIFNKLREWALEKPPRQPLRGVTDKGIQWANSNDEYKELSFDALGKRLKKI